MASPETMAQQKKGLNQTVPPIHKKRGHFFKVILHPIPAQKHFFKSTSFHHYLFPFSKNFFLL
jgi:hypothetical protein